MLLTLLILIVLVMIAMIATRLLSQRSSSKKRHQHQRRWIEPKLSPIGTSCAQADEKQALEPLISSVTLDDVESEPTSSLIVLNLVADADQIYGGYELFQAILSVGLRHGAMNIFHRYSQANAQGEVLFSLASLMEPGTFDLSAMGSYQTQGLCFFVRTDRVSSKEQAVLLMVDTVLQLQEELGGFITNERQQVLDGSALRAYDDIHSIISLVYQEKRPMHRQYKDKSSDDDR